MRIESCCKSHQSWKREPMIIDNILILSILIDTINYLSIENNEGELCQIINLSFLFII